jgi:hypothetical protein
MRVVTIGKLEELKTAVRAFAVTLADGQGRWADEQAVAAALTQGMLNGGQIFSAYAEVARREGET